MPAMTCTSLDETCSCLFSVFFFGFVLFDLWMRHKTRCCVTHAEVDIFEVNFVHNNDGKGDGEAPGFFVVVVLYAASLDALKLVGSIEAVVQLH